MFLTISAFLVGSTTETVCVFFVAGSFSVVAEIFLFLRAAGSRVVLTCPGIVGISNGCSCWTRSFGVLILLFKPLDEL